MRNVRASVDGITAKISANVGYPLNAEVHYRIEYIAYREKLHLDKLADRVAAQQKTFAEDPDLYRRYAAANTVLARLR
jgi:hypothetical protein